MAAIVGVARDGSIRGSAVRNSEQEDSTYKAVCRQMTPEVLSEICKTRNMWSQPHLNTQLFLNYKGFESISGLQDYVKVRCLHLGNNNIARIEGLDRMPELRTLYLESNRITKIENLELNLELRHLSLDGNGLTRVSGIAHLSKLELLNVANNGIQYVDDVREVAVPPSLSNVDMSNNHIEETDGIVELWTEMKERLRVLRFHGNPAVRHVPHYRKRLINACSKLSYLDERPVFPVERKSSEAWATGGQEAMQKARRDHHEQMKESNRTDPERRELLTAMRKAAVARIEREARERAEQEEQRLAGQKGKSGSDEPENAVQAGDLDALAKYEKTWQTKVSLHGYEGVRAQVAGNSVASQSSGKQADEANQRADDRVAAADSVDLGDAATNVASQSSETQADDASQRAEAPKVAADAASEAAPPNPTAPPTPTASQKAAAAIRQAQLAAQAVRYSASPGTAGTSPYGNPFGNFCPPSRSAAGARQRDGTSHLAPRWAPSAGDFKATNKCNSGGSEVGVTTDQDAAEAYRENEDRQFAVLGEDVWAGSSVGSSFHSDKQADGGGFSGISGLSSSRAREIADDETVPDLWKRNAERNAEAEKKALEMSFAAATEQRKSAATATERSAVGPADNELGDLD